MIYAVPQTGWTENSRRVKTLKLRSENAADELLLTKLFDFFENDGTISIGNFEYELSERRENE